MTFLTTSDGVRLRYTDRGAGPRTIVLVHGWKMSHRVWDRMVAELAEDFRVVAFDLRGMGESDKPNSRYDFEELAGDLGSVIEVLGLDEVVLMGWSMGCSVALEYLRQGGRAVSKLVLMAGPIKLTRADDFPWAIDPDLFDSIVADVANRWPVGEREFIGRYFRDPHQDVVDWLYGITLQTPLDVVLKVVRHQVELDFRAFLPTISVPTLAVYGRHDYAYPVGLADYIAESVPAGRSIILEESAHVPFVEDPERCRDLLAAFAAETA